MEKSNSKLTKKKYEELDKLALQFRIDYNLVDEKIDFFALMDILGIKLVKYSELNYKQKKVIKHYTLSDDAFTVRNNDLTVIFYNDEKNENRIRFSLAHEIKHYIKGETDCNEIIEMEANHFARQLLAPTCLVMKYIDCEEEKISDVFGLSIEASKYALLQAKNRNQYNFIKPSKEEKEFLDLFKKTHKNT